MTTQNSDGSQTINFGIFGSATVERDADGYIEVPVVIEESGLFAGAPPAELRIHEVLMHNEPGFNRRYVAALNRRTDLPFYLATAKVRVAGPLEKVTDDMIRAEGLEPLPDEG